MAADLFYGLLPDHLVLLLMLTLMVLELARVPQAWARWVFVGGMALALAVLAQHFASGFVAVIIPGEIVVDEFATIGKAVVVACGLALGLGFAAQRSFKFWMLTASSLLGAMLIFDSAGFASLFIGIELLSLPIFALMVHERGTSAAPEGAFKYLVLSSLASALLLFGISLAYGQTASLSIADFASALPQGSAQMQAAGLLILCGLFLKAAVFPLHAWAPDAYAGARLQVTALMASVVKAAVVLALVRIFGVAALAPSTALVIGLLAVASIFFGNLAALGQTRFKRLLAYSSVAHAGYMVFALLDRTQNRAEDLLWYVAIYALASLLACAAFAVFCPGEEDELQALEGGFAAHPVAALLLAVALLSLAGLPPFPGFFAKLFIFKSVIASGHLVGAVLAFIGSFIGLPVYLGMVVRLFRTDAAAAPARAAQRRA